MPIFDIPGPDAVATRKANKYATWGNRNQPNRVEPITRPHFDVGFRLEPGESIFTVGSCFARHVEQALMNRGFRIPMRELFNREEFMGLEPGVVNNFGTPSIYNEFAWALGEQEYSVEDNIVEVAKGKFADLHVIPSLRPTDFDTVLRRRKAITEAYRSFRECRVVIITLGLVEIWFDAKTGLYLNSTPRPSLLRNEPDRFRLHVLSCEEASDYLDRAVSLIRKHGREDVQILMTISPVPLSATHRDADVIVANTYSKSVLRAVAGTMEAKYPNVTYYPSYESIMLSDRKRAWKDDLVHVTDELVALNVNRMVDTYVGSMGTMEDHRAFIKAGGEAAALELAEKMRKGSQEEARAFFEEFAGISTRSREFAAEHASFLMDIGEHEAALNVLRNAPGADEPSSLILQARALLKTQRPEEAWEVLLKAEAGGERSAAFWTLYLDTAKALDNEEKVLEVMNKWITAVPQRSARAHALVGRWFQEKGKHERAIPFFHTGINLDGEDALIRIYLVESLLAAGDVEAAREAFAEIRPLKPNEAILYERLKPRVQG